MPVYAVQQIEQGQRLVPFIPNKIGEELDACSEIGGKERNKLKTFLQAQGIPSITEMDYSLREKFEQNLKDEQQLKQVSRYLLAYDRVKQYSIRQQMQTLSGRLQCQWKLENKVLFLPYHPNQEIAVEFDSVRHRPNMVWDFTKLCSESLKKQIFLTLDAIIEQIKDMRKRECRLTGLKYLYEFCAEHQIADIEKLELDQIKEFECYLDEKTNNPRRKELLLPILNFCRQTVFLQNDKIHWDANVWYLERMNLPKHRVNESDYLLTELQKRNIIAKTFNECVTGISQFYRLMIVHGHMERMPFHPEYYLKKVIRTHHDRSVSTDICTELLGKIYLLPEHLRCMYLHLWCLGLRISEVCTLKGNAYYRKDNETWIKVYQIKMKTYKRIPIAEGLCK